MAQLSVYLLGFLVLVIGMAYGAHLAGLPNTWIGVGVLVVLGLGIISGASRLPRGGGRAQ